MTQLDTQAIVDALSTERRRRTVRTLAADGEQLLRPLSEQLAEQTAGPGYDSATRKAIYVTLYQHHLPTLDDLGVIEWAGSSSDPVTPTQRLDTVVDALDALEHINEDTPGIRGFLTGALADADAGNHGGFTGP